MSRRSYDYPCGSGSKEYGRQHKSHSYHRSSHESHQHEHRRREPSGIRSEKHFKHSSGHRVPAKATGNTYLSRDDISRLAKSTSKVVSNCVDKKAFAFLAAYDYQRFCEDREIVRQLVDILHLLTQAEDFARIAPRTIARIFDRNCQYAHFICNLKKNVLMMGRDKHPSILRQNLSYLKKLTEIGLKMLSSLPDTSIGTFPILPIKEAIDDISEKINVSDRIKEDVKAMVDLYNQEHSQRDVRRGNASTSYESIDDRHILPPLEGLVSCDRPNVQSNIIKGPYNNWKHYLETQYQLMREDFLSPLRKGICNLGGRLDSNEKEENLYAYNNVKIREPVFLYTGVGFQLHFDVPKSKSINWENSKRLMFGSLLCLSKNGFKSSILYASVMKRDPSLLSDGFVTVKFEKDVADLGINAKDTFTMVESMAYFEAYKHVLTKLKELSARVDTLPFKKYIVDCCLQNVPFPSYASLQLNQLRFDLSSVLNWEANVIITEPASWPSFSHTCLDESQLRAFKSALTKEVSVIQGPPGTGKTYIGLKIIEAYLQNRSIWDCMKESPILVICYTNHALDQFLEGVQQLTIASKNPSIIRIGGRCKNVKLSKCVLQNKVDDFREAQKVSRSLFRGMTDAHIGMTVTKNEMDCQTLPSRSQQGCSRHSLSQLKHVMLERHFNSFQAMKGTNESKILQWLDPRSASSSYLKSRSSMKSKNCIDVDDKFQEDSRVTQGEEVELKDKAHVSEMSSYDSYKVSETKRRRVEKDCVSKPMTTAEMSQINDIFSLSNQKKWQLYNYWEKQLLQIDLGSLGKGMNEYDEWCKKYQKFRKEVEKDVLFGADVIGMTTTGAAKHHHLLQKIHPKIVIFEEAAEIFESHIITSLPPSVQQIILIGDHQQLRPKPNCYDLELKHNLGVSLFERLVSNGIQYETLEVQHRMRPEVSSLIHPSIYPHLTDHESVNKYESIRGIAENVFLVSHSEREKSTDGSGSKTHVNEFEADYIVALCHYLLKQGYQPSQITILTMYRGQLFAFRTRMTRETFNGVRVTVVDDYQGEENDIILLSLVRSNSDAKIGFLKESNRICVSLSRAKMGLYIIGNADILRKKDETIWPKIIEVLEKRKCVKNALPLYCAVHTTTNVWAHCPEDFLKSPEGGCEKKCGTRLACGHACPKMCHPKDMNHTKYICMKECTQKLPCQHKCKHKCFECKLGCQPCTIKVSKVIPTCNHSGIMRCCDDPKKFKCKAPCTKTLKCGHSCTNICSEPCTTQCHSEIEKKLPCGHITRGKCSAVIKCMEPCRAILDCGDVCTGTCGECYMGRMHKRCDRKCGRQLFCGHTCDFPCASSCPPCLKPCSNFCVHSKCPKKCYEPCTPCMEPCEWKCEHLECTKWCGEICDRPPCNQPCTKTLKKCGHPCIGLCGEKCPPLCRICDRDEVCEIFFGTEDEIDARFIQLEDCKHIIEVTGMDRCVLESDNQGSDETHIKFSECPKCRTAIRTSLRYCNKVKQVLADVEELKKKEIQLPGNFKDKFGAVNQIKCPDDFLKKELEKICKEVKNHESLLPGKANALLVQISMFDAIAKILNNFSDVSTINTPRWLKNSLMYSESKMKEYLRAAKRFVSQDYLSKQQISDVTGEIRRLSCAANIFQMISKLNNSNLLTTEHQEKTKKYLELIHVCGWKRKRLEESEEKEILDFVQEIESTYNLGISAKERIDIVQAIGLKKGHWYKCPKGHYYCIGECGGAMEKAKCPECGSVIGGQHHQLDSDNAHAPEMDDSSYPAWSERANLENFDLRNLH